MFGREEWAGGWVGVCLEGKGVCWGCGWLGVGGMGVADRGGQADGVY